MFYEEAVDFMQNLEKFGSSYGLETVRALLRRLGNPQESLKFIHIAGTNGKGSTSCFITNILLANGYCVGTFNSPSVFGYNERFLLDGKAIDNGSVAKYVSIVAEVRAKMIGEGLSAPTAFEIEFAVAMLIFKDSDCDFAVLECGLGGRLDATNCIPKKEVAIITAISYDHTAILGDTLEAIANEKAAIATDCPLITFRQCDEVMEVFEKASDLRICPDAKLISADVNGQYFKYRREKYFIRQLGVYQLQNCSLAIECAKTLAEKGYAISDENIKKGIASAIWKGRLQLINKNSKTFLLDGAHNPDGALSLAKALKDYFSDKKKCFVFGMFSDKDIDGVLANIGQLADEFITVKPLSKRGLDANATLEKCKKYQPRSQSAQSIEEAIKDAYLGDYPLIVVCGSLSILNDALNAINNLN